MLQKSLEATRGKQQCHDGIRYILSTKSRESQYNHDKNGRSYGKKRRSLYKNQSSYQQVYLIRSGTRVRPRRELNIPSSDSRLSSLLDIQQHNVKSLSSTHTR